MTNVAVRCVLCNCFKKNVRIVTEKYSQLPKHSVSSPNNNIQSALSLLINIQSAVRIDSFILHSSPNNIQSAHRIFSQLAPRNIHSVADQYINWPGGKLILQNSTTIQKWISYFKVWLLSRSEIDSNSQPMRLLVRARCAKISQLSF